MAAPPERLVRHVFWKYPIISAVLVLVVAALAWVAGSPNYPRATIAAAARGNPGGCILALTQELDGTSTSSANAKEFGMGDPGQVFVMGPLRDEAPLLGEVSVQGLPSLQGPDVRQAIASYDAASADQQTRWAADYDKALGTITPAGTGATGMTSPDGDKVGTLKGDFGPVPVLVETGLYLAQNGYLEEHLQAVDPGHSFHLTNLWLYDHADMLNTAIAEGLTDDQWGMVKERGFSVGPWYLVVPAVFHVYFPQGATGQGFVLWNLAFAAVLLFVVPLVPGMRSLPRYLKLYRFIYRYPKSHEMEKSELRERHDPTHGHLDGGIE